MEPQLFFILGCQRSGTTLVRLVLESHPLVACFDEVRAYSVLKGYSEQGRSAIPDLPKQAERIGFKIPRWTEQFLDAEFRDEGQPEICPNFYQGEKILFLIRDVRDVVVSMRRLRVGPTASWLDYWPPRVLFWKMIRNPRFQETYRRELAILSKTDDSLTAIAALYWTFKTRVVLDYLAAGLPVLPVFYDELVKEPRGSLGAVCEHLEIEWDGHILMHHELEHPETFEDGTTVGGTDPKARISLNSLNQWTAVLTAPELDLIDQIAGPTSDQMSALRVRAGVSVPSW